MNQAVALFPKTQVISQLKKTQKVRFRQRDMTVAPYFATQPGVARVLPAALRDALWFS
jgi:sirohydrochlorin ferrochelatase